MNQFSREEMLIGKENIDKKKKKKVAVFGIGGVGTFVIEGLVRSGIEHFILVDNDVVSLTNLIILILLFIKYLFYSNKKLTFNIYLNGQIKY